MADPSGERGGDKPVMACFYFHRFFLNVNVSILDVHKIIFNTLRDKNKRHINCQQPSVTNPNVSNEHNIQQTNLVTYIQIQAMANELQAMANEI